MPESGSGASTVNIAAYLPEMAAKHPFRRAVIFPEGRDRKGRVAYTHRTFRQLNEDSDRIAHGLAGVGIGRSCPTALLVTPSLEFVAIAFALFKVGAVPVFVDPGMGRKAMLQCFREAAPEGFIGIPRAQLARRLFPGSFKSVRVAINVGRSWGLGGISLEELMQGASAPHPVAATEASEVAAILFTSGSTGIPKGVPFTHGMIQGQVDLQKSTYQIGEDEVDMPAFPLFALFSTAFGIPAVIPDMDPTRPAHVDPRRIVEAVENQGVTHTFGSPAIWHQVGNYCDEQGIVLPSMRRILMAGAPVPGRLLQRWQRILPAGEVHTPYGATEALGVSTISAREVVEDTWGGNKEGRGTCVGRLLPGMEVRILEITESPIELGPQGWAPHEAAAGDVGEITVRGPVVASEYMGRPKETRTAKVLEQGTVWHRMGDLGYFDDQGRLWFCGRKSHRVIRNGLPLFTVQIEGRFNSLDGIHRTALVGVPGRTLGQSNAVLIVEPDADSRRPRDTWKRELLDRARRLNLPIDDILFHDSFPVDVRHNAKIRREILAKWAAGSVADGARA